MAVQGKISQRWHHLLTAQNPSQIKRAISSILNVVTPQAQIA